MAPHDYLIMGTRIKMKGACETAAPFVVFCKTDF